MVATGFHEKYALCGVYHAPAQMTIFLKKLWRYAQKSALKLRKEGG